MSMNSGQSKDLRVAQEVIRLVENAKHETELTIDGLPGVFVVINRDGFILRSDRFFESIRGMNAEEVLFSNLCDIFEPETWTIFLIRIRELESAIRSSGGNREGVSFELPLKNSIKGNSVFLWQLKAFLGAANGDILFYVFGQDMTDLRLKEKQLTEIFESIPVGIITIDSLGFIEPHYSKFCEHLFGVGNLANEKVFDRIFKPGLNELKESDQKGAYALVDALGQTSDVFHLLSTAFPKRIVIPEVEAGKGKKYLEVSYQPIVLSGKVDRILLMFTDSTGANTATTEVALQNKMQMIRDRKIAEIRSVGPDLIRMGVDELGKLINVLKQYFENDDWFLTFNDMHSLKGNARLLGLKSLSEMVHDLETSVSKIVNEDFDPERQANCKSAFAEIEKEWSEYKLLYESMSEEFGLKENQSEAQQAVDPRSQALVTRYNDLLQNDPKPDSTFLRDRVQLAISAVNQISSDSFKSIAVARAEEVASSAKKLVRVEFFGPPVNLPSDSKSLINDCILHVVSNAIAHGIELPEERLKQGKTEMGTISFKFQEDKGVIHIEISDDGKGIDVARVLQLATQKGLVTLEQSMQMSDDQIINIIFEPGFSTAATVDHVAGRGVGLAAVKEKLQLSEGDIKVTSKGHGKGTKFVITFDPIKAALSKRLIPQLGFVSALEEQLKALSDRGHLTLEVSLDPKMKDKDHLLFCDTNKVSLAISTLVATCSGAMPAKAFLVNQNDKLVIKITPENLSKATGSNLLASFPEYESARVSCEMILQRHGGSFSAVEDGFEISFGFIVDASRIPVIRFYMKLAENDEDAAALLSRIEKWTNKMDLKFEITTDINSASLVIGSEVDNTIEGVVDKNALWPIMRSKIIEAIESSIGIKIKKK